MGGGAISIDSTNYNNKNDLLIPVENRKALHSALGSAIQGGEQLQSFSDNSVVQSNGDNVSVSAKVNNLIDSEITVNFGSTQILLDSLRHRQGDVQVYPPLMVWNALKREEIFVQKDDTVTIGQIFTNWNVDDRHPDNKPDWTVQSQAVDPELPREYVIFGYWLHGNMKDLAKAHVGSFAVGPELGLPSPNRTIQGTATYNGIAGGLYTYSVDHPQLQYDEAGDFVGDITLKADFDQNSVSGCIGCNTGINLNSVTNRNRVPEMLQSKLTPSSTRTRILLHDANIKSSGDFSGKVTAHSDYGAVNIPYFDTGSSGSWVGALSKEQDQGNHPRLLAGTFGADLQDSFMGKVQMLGAWIATKESAATGIELDYDPNLPFPLNPPLTPQ